MCAEGQQVLAKCYVVAIVHQADSADCLTHGLNPAWHVIPLSVHLIVGTACWCTEAQQLLSMCTLHGGIPVKMQERW
jgi:hypothetical protein